MSKPARASLPVALLLVAACAAGSRPAPAKNLTPAPVIVSVRNDLVPRTSITVRIVSASGTRTILGIVPPGATRELRFDEPFLESTYRLIADTVEGSEVSSRAFELFPQATVHWRLSNNTLDFTVR